MMAVALVAITIAISWLHPAIVFRGQIYSSSDAQAAAAFQSLGDGSGGSEFPHWNPFVFAGMPSYASLAHNPGAYPLTTPLRIARDTLGLPPMFWMLFHLALAGLATVAWVRWRGQSWAAAIAAGCWVVVLPKLTAWGAYGHGTKLGSFAWLPLVGWCTEALLRRGGIGWASGLALAMGMMLLRGHVQIAYYAVMLVGILVLAALIAGWRDPDERKQLLQRTGLVVAAGVVALGMSLVLYLPVLEYQAHSIRGSGGGGGDAFAYATNWSLSWPEFATMWWPSIAGYGRGAYAGQMPFTDYPNYIGLPLLILALAGVLARRDRMTWALVAMIVLATMLALGRNFFVYQIFYELLPGFRKFRVPVMILAVQQLALILLAARGLDALFSDREDRLPLPRPVVAILITVGLLGLILGSVGATALRESAIDRLTAMARHFGRPVPPSGLLLEAAELMVGDALRLGAVFLGGTIVLVAARARKIPALAGVGIVMLLVFLDLWRVDQPLLRPEDHLSRLARSSTGVVAVESPSLLADADALVDYTKDSDLARWLKSQSARPRVLPLGGLEVDNQLAAQRVVSLGGYHAAKLKLYEDIRAKIFDPSAPRLKLARMFAAQWMVTPRPLTESTLVAIGRLGLSVDPEPVWSGADGVAYAIQDALPRAWVVSEVAVERPGEDTTGTDPDPAVLQQVLAAQFDPAVRAILSAPADPVPRPGAEAAHVEVLEEGYNHWSVRVELPEPGVLVTADPWYPGWTVQVDGEPGHLLRANYAQRAVALSAGSHVVEFSYGAQAWVRGRRIARISGLLILAGWIVPPVLARRRRSRVGQEQS